MGTTTMDASLELTKRQQTPRWFGISIQIFTVLAALAVASLALLAVDLNPLVVYDQMFLGAITDPFQTSRVLNRSAPLILAGLAVYIPLRSGLYNIGAEGQLIMGGLVTLWVGVNAPDLLGVSGSGVITLVLAFLAAAVVGAIWVLVPVVLYAKYRANEILTTLMLVFTAERLSNFLISGPLQSSAGTFPRTARVDMSVPTLFGRVHVGILLAVLAVIATWLLINKTRLGYEIVLSGSNDSVAEQTGISTGKITFVVFTVAAGFAGLAGFMEVAASQPTLTLGWEPGYGWTAIPIALLGRRGAFQTMAAGLMFGVIFVGGLVVETSFGVPSAIAQIIEALLILFLITAEFIKTYRFDVRIGAWSLRESLAGAIGTDRLEGT
jgi:simple sugar transport system permease protein